MHYLLKGNGIPHTLVERGEMDWQIVYPDTGYVPAKDDIVVSVIQAPYSYGGKNNLLEITGLLTEEELEDDDVAGNLTAADVFGRIQAHWTAFNRNN